MSSEAPRTPSAVMLQYLRKHKGEKQEILRLIELFSPQWEERRKDSSTASQDAEIIQTLRNRLSELAQDARAELEKSLLKFEQLRGKIEQEKEKNLALFADKMRPLSEGLKTLDGLLAAPSARATTKASATKAATPRGASKTGASAKAKASSGASKKARKGSPSKAKSSSKSATKSAAKSSSKSSATPEATPAESATKGGKTSEG